MSDRSATEGLVYPAPTLVIGVGRLGLAVLERLGQDWYDLARAGADPSLDNLRLLQVAPVGGGDVWRRRERETAAVADYVGESDLPSLALDLAILRSLGLVRYRNGSYQVAVPQDGGVSDLEREGRDGSNPSENHATGTASPSEEDEREPTLRRLRYFDWRELSPDPVVAAERLKRLTDRNSDLDLFVTPILNRVRQGHSPGTILACVARAAALRDRRDPAPWKWVGTLVENQECERDRGPEGSLCFRFGPGASRHAERYLGLNVEFDVKSDPLERTSAAPPLPSWKKWRLAVQGSQPADERIDSAATEQETSPPSPTLQLRIPGPFVPGPGDLPSTLELHGLLKLDWESTGWVTDITESSERPPFLPIPASSFRLGLFDHDGDRKAAEDTIPQERLGERMRHLGTLVHQGLVRLWIDLHRERVEERHPVLDNRRREHDEEALRQTLEVLGELLVRKLHDTSTGCTPPGAGASAEELPVQPSKFLESITLEPRARSDQTRSALTRRLAALGLDESGTEKRRPLLRQIRLGVAEAPTEDDPTPGSETRLTGLPSLRRTLNRVVRRLFDIETLASYRNWPTRRPPRLTVYLVGDMGEPFVRTAMQPLLREAHAELLRAFGPILEYFREGFDRGLSVTPILWMPHPADPFEGGDGGGAGTAGPDRAADRRTSAGRCEEAAIITAVHRIRRWVESVIPPTRRRVSQIFVNSRVTDVAVLDHRDAVRQTRDFITFQARNDLSRSEWLRRTAEGPPGDDFFASFTCYEIDFPAEKAREYLANRLGRDCLRRLKTAQDEEPPEIPERLLDPPHLTEQVTTARHHLAGAVRPAADRLASTIEDRCPLLPSTPERELEDRFDHRFEDELLERIQRDWQELSRERGGMDELVDGLREMTSQLLSERVLEVHREGDRLVETHAVEGGVQAAIASFRRFGRSARLSLEGREEERRSREAVARRHSVPATGNLGTARHRVLEAARRRPDETPIRFGMILWFLLAPILGAPLAHALAYALDLHRHPNWVEPLLGPGGWAVGGAALFLAAYAGVRTFQRRRHRDLVDAVRAMAQTGRRILEGRGREPAEEAEPSVRSFLESRLLLTEGLTARGFALRIFERVEADRKLAERLNRSIDVQATLLAQQAEDLGVRPTLHSASQSSLAQYPSHDDVSRLFSTRSGDTTERLISPERLVELYRRWVGVGDDEVESILPRLLRRAGGFAAWRESACLSDTAAILGVGKEEFGFLVDTPLPAQHRLAEEVGDRLCRFVARYYANVGFGARFSGYEGLDPDGVQVSADAALVLHEDLARVYERARSRPDAPPTTATMRVITKPVRPGAAYMFSLAQGIRAHSVRNLKRFESFHGRPHLPEDRTFPVSEELEGPSLNLLSKFESLAGALHDRFQDDSEREGE